MSDVIDGDPVLQPAEPAPPVAVAAPIQAAGVMFVAGGRVLLVQRSGQGDLAGTWAFPGGKVEDGEDDRTAAARECQEELQIEVDAAALKPFDLSDDGLVRYRTFTLPSGEQFVPTLNDEHTGYQWADVAGPWPAPMHPGAASTLAKLTATELDVARAISQGLLPSPTRFHNVTLFALRLFGTGVAWRERKGEREYTYRSPDIFLNEEFLARCNGLPVVLEHPEGLTLDSEEFKDRAIGTIMLPYLRLDEVWGIARVYDDAAIQIMADTKLSTSPTVEFTHSGVNEKVDVEGGHVLLIENVPSLLDHVAICVEGVWDKGGPPTGVASVTAQEPTMTEEEKKAAADAAAKAAKTADTKKADEMGRDETVDPDDKKWKSEMQGYMDSLKAEIAALKGSKKADATESEDEKMARLRKEADAKKADATESEDEKEAREKKEREDKEKADSKKADATAATIAELRAQVQALAGQIPKPVSLDEEAKYTAAQAEADGVYQAFGDRAPRTLHGESLLAYRKRLLGGLQQHSAAWKDVSLADLPENVLSVAAQAIYADAVVLARSPASAPANSLRATTRTDGTNRVITEFVGDPDACWGPFKQSPKTARFNNTHNAPAFG